MKRHEKYVAKKQVVSPTRPATAASTVLASASGPIGQKNLTFALERDRVDRHDEVPHTEDDDIIVSQKYQPLTANVSEQGSDVDTDLSSSKQAHKILQSKLTMSAKTHRGKAQVRQLLKAKIKKLDDRLAGRKRPKVKKVPVVPPLPTPPSDMTFVPSTQVHTVVTTQPPIVESALATPIFSKGGTNTTTTHSSARSGAEAHMIRPQFSQYGYGASSGSNDQSNMFTPSTSNVYSQEPMMYGASMYGNNPSYYDQWNWSNQWGHGWPKTGVSYGNGISNVPFTGVAPPVVPPIVPPPPPPSVPTPIVTRTETVPTVTINTVPVASSGVRQPLNMYDQDGNLVTDVFSAAAAALAPDIDTELFHSCNSLQ
jgi:hypothetical protein